MKITGLNISNFVVSLTWLKVYNRNCEENIGPFSFLIPHVVLTLQKHYKESSLYLCLSYLFLSLPM